MPKKPPRTKPDQAILKSIADNCIARRVRMLNRAVSSVYDDALRPFGIKISQMNVLVAIGRFGEARPAQVSQALNLEKSTLSRNVERMVERGWLENLPGDDSRSCCYSLTSEGMELIRAAWPAWKQAQKQAQKITTAEEYSF